MYAEAVAQALHRFALMPSAEQQAENVEEAIKAKRLCLALEIASNPDRLSNHGSEIDWMSIRVRLFDREVDYFDAGDRAMIEAARGNEVMALAIMRRRFEALCEYLDTAPFVAYLARKEIEQDLTVDYDPADQYVEETDHLML